MELPNDWTTNGVGGLGMVLQNPDRPPTNVRENSHAFTGLSYSIHLGLSILESPQGQQTLRRLGRTVMEEWENIGAFQPTGDVRNMSRYVQIFLETLRGDFPRVFISNLGGPQVLALARRVEPRRWDGNLERFLPKHTAGIFFNRSRVDAMVDASSQSAHSSTMVKRYHSFLFLFGVATAHELCHLFVTYLAGGRQEAESYTPPRVSYLNYYGEVDANNQPVIGESGRWVENRLFGGSIEFYRNVREDDNQTGIPYVLDKRALARKIDPECMMRLVRSPRDFEDYPFTTTGNALTVQDRRARGLLCLGSTQTTPSQGGSYMRGRHEGNQPLFHVSARELSRVPLVPGYIVRAVRVA